MDNNLLLIPIVLAFVMGGVALLVRMKAAKKPASLKKIILPPIFMSTGFLMFLYEPTRPAPLQVAEALAVGMIFSILLIMTSKFEIRNHQIYLQRSKAFMFILLGLLVIRIAFRAFLGKDINPEELSGMFFLLAYGMILPWRISMLVSFRKIERRLHRLEESPIVHSKHEPAPNK
ncbi:CcdC family protein [Alkalicoccobacillus porphyridii]|uniref:Cytochrome c biogenesis protein CcdC n=1 Tax=Alkalicoccobacillus porphyridii TaxID=2597270 RepID=A0A554A387_9BACI|nr:cytochrome c biogenesis protein CcdC [Alkalicoccobacillus porphyridii]TSB48157.1 cytochrome c biogenesis protein CcdC [Alkalicoccobacillus porphyridii]